MKISDEEFENYKKIFIMFDKVFCKYAMYSNIVYMYVAICEREMQYVVLTSPQLIAVENSTAQVISKTRTAMEPCQPKNWVRS